MKRRNLTLLLSVFMLATPLLGVNAYADDSEDDDKKESSDSSESSDSKSDSHDDDDENVFHFESSESESHYEDDEDQERALKAVEHEGVKPLRDMLATFESRIGGQVINVELIQNWFRLQYKFTFIDSAGRVRKAYFDAKTGDSID